MLKVLKKIEIIPLLTLFIGLGLMNGSLAQRKAMAGRVDTIPMLQISGLQAWAQNNNLSLQNLSVHALYAVGRPGFLSVSRIPYLDIIRQDKAQAITSDTVSFPSLQIEKESFRGSYNMIVFVVSLTNDALVPWANPDVNPNPTSYKFLQVIEKPFIDTFLTQQSDATTPLKINL